VALSEVVLLVAVALGIVTLSEAGLLGTVTASRGWCPEASSLSGVPLMSRLQSSKLRREPSLPLPLLLLNLRLLLKNVCLPLLLVNLCLLLKNVCLPLLLVHV